VIVVLNALMGLPPVVVGLAIYLLLSRAGPLGELGRGAVHGDAPNVVDAEVVARQRRCGDHRSRV
jgi:ABC-type molybdate transport system permease subunit